MAAQNNRNEKKKIYNERQSRNFIMHFARADSISLSKKRKAHFYYMNVNFCPIRWPKTFLGTWVTQTPWPPSQGGLANDVVFYLMRNKFLSNHVAERYLFAASGSTSLISVLFLQRQSATKRRGLIILRQSERRTITFAIWLDENFKSFEKRKQKFNFYLSAHLPRRAEKPASFLTLCGYTSEVGFSLKQGNFLSNEIDQRWLSELWLARRW